MRARGGGALREITQVLLQGGCAAVHALLVTDAGVAVGWAGQWTDAGRNGVVRGAFSGGGNRAALGAHVLHSHGVRGFAGAVAGDIRCPDAGTANRCLLLHDYSSMGE